MKTDRYIQERFVHDEAVAITACLKQFWCNCRRN